MRYHTRFCGVGYVVAALIASSCTGDVPAPSAPEQNHQIRRFTAGRSSLNGYVDGNVIGVYAETGGNYILNLDQKTLQFPNGLTLALSADDAVRYANVFRTIVEDAPAQLEPRLNDLGPMYSRQAPPGSRRSPTTFGPTHGARPPAASREQSRTRLRFVSRRRGHATPVKATARPSTQGASALLGDTGLDRSADVMRQIDDAGMMLGPDCYDLSWDIRNLTASWRAAKVILDAKLRSLGDELAQIVAQNGLNPGMYLSKETAVLGGITIGVKAAPHFMEVAGAVIAHEYYEARLNATAKAFSDMRCWEPGPQWTPDRVSGGGGSGYGWDCWIELWEISFDGGLTWWPFEVPRCAWFDLMS